MKERDIVVFSETAEDEALLDKAEFALSQARASTKNIKYDDSALNIMVELGTIVDELGVEEVKKELEYLEDAVREANNNLESAVYGLEEPFQDLIRTLRNKIDDEEMDRQDQEWEDQKRREQESKLVAPDAKGKKILDHLREPLVDDVTLLDPAIDAEFINWIKEKSKGDMFQFSLGDLQDPQVLLKLKQEYHKETDRYAGDGGNLQHGTPRSRRSQPAESEADQHYGFYLSQKAMKLWLRDNPGKTKRDWKYIGVDVQDEYSQKAGGKKGKYLGKGASEYTRESDDDVDYKDFEPATNMCPDCEGKGKRDGKACERCHGAGEVFEAEVDYKNMRAGEFAKAHGDQWELTTTKRAADILHDLVEPILDSFESRDELEAYMTDNVPELGREYDSEEAIEQAFDLLDLNDDTPKIDVRTENTNESELPSIPNIVNDDGQLVAYDWDSAIELAQQIGIDNRDLKYIEKQQDSEALLNFLHGHGYSITNEQKRITTGPTRSNVRLTELRPERENSANEEKVADLIRNALGQLTKIGGPEPTGEDCYELFAELESINPELADLYKDVALHQYDVPLEESLNEIKRWQAIAAAVAILAGLWGVNNKLAQKAYDNSDQLQQLIQLHQKYEKIVTDTDSIKIRNQAEEYVDQLEDRIRTHKLRIDIGDGEVMGPDARPIPVVDPGAPVGDRGGADFRFPGDPDQQQEARRPTTSSTHSTTKDIKKHDPFHGHTHPEGGNPKVCPKCKGAGCPACDDTGEVISKLRNDPKVESLKWTPGSDKKSWWDK